MAQATHVTMFVWTVFSLSLNSLRKKNLSLLELSALPQVKTFSVKRVHKFLIPGLHEMMKPAHADQNIPDTSVQ